MPGSRLPLESTSAVELRETPPTVPRTKRKMPDRACEVYTPGAPKTPTFVEEIGALCLIRLFWKLPKKNVLFFLIGPPTSKPYSCSLRSGRDLPAALLNHSLALKTLLRLK